MPWPSPPVQQFQFTRPQGARRRGYCNMGYKDCFNSRAHKGRDYVVRRAVVRGAEFQFTRPQGARLYEGATANVWHKFQFTRPQGARLKSTSLSNGEIGFNSRAHKGRDPI